jgi:hypothetical protein
VDKENRPVEIQDLNKTQLILLAILLSFVTSIATGIVTVTLMQQAPQGVTQTINRVVQHTIEKVAPETVGKVQTVVVKEDDLVVDAIKRTRANIVYLYPDKVTTTAVAEAYSMGNGQFVTATGTIEQGKTYIVRVGSSIIEVKALLSSGLGYVILGPETITDAAKKLPKSHFGKNSDIAAGQTAVIVSLEAVTKGTVQGLVTKEDKDTEGTVLLTWQDIETNPTVGATFIGSFVVNLDGSVVGIVLPRGEGARILGIDTVLKSMTIIPKSTTTSSSTR